MERVEGASYCGWISTPLLVWFSPQQQQKRPRSSYARSSGDVCSKKTPGPIEGEKTSPDVHFQQTQTVTSIFLRFIIQCVLVIRSKETSV